MGINFTRRGSALLMVVGLLTMIAMLGGTFLVVAHLDARQTESLMAKAQADPLAAGVASQLMAVMAADLNIGDHGPYSTTDAGNWTVYATCPSEDVAHYKYLHVEDSATSIQHLSNLQGASSHRVDCDGDGTNDAYLIDTKIKNSRGETYYVAVKIRDLAGLLNVNVHSKTSPPMVPPSVSNVDLLGFLSSTRFNALQVDRAGSDVTPMVWWTNAGRRIYNPLSGRPFAIGDEMYLRWMGSPSIAQTGRLYTALGQGANYGDRDMLTTASCTRDLLRRPSAGFLEKFLVTWSPTSTFLDNAAVRNRLRAELAYAYGAGSSSGGGGGTGETREKTIDDGETGFSTNCPNHYVKTGCGYAGDFHWNEYPGDGIEQYWATWQEGSIPAGSTVDVKVYYCPHSSRGSSVPVTIYDGNTSLGTKTIDQTQGPDQGVGEADLGSYEINSGSITVKMTDAGVADGLISADAVTFTIHEPAPPPPPSTGDKGPEIEHFLANLWASLSPYDSARTKAHEWAYDSTDATKKVYGLVNQPFLVEAYAHHHSDKDVDTDGTPDQTWMYGYAIKLMNPSSRPLDLSNVHIKGLTGTSTEKTLGSLIGDLGAGAGKLPANGPNNYVILYDYDSGTNYKNSAGVREPLTDLKFKTGGNATRWIQCEGLRFWGNATIKIVRRIGTATDIPLDSIDCSELGYDASESEIKQTDDQEEKASARRDDSLTRGRYSVAVYKKDTTDTASHHLNDDSTGAGTSDIHTDSSAGEPWCPMGFHVDVPHADDVSKRPTSPADFGLLLTAGPRQDKDLPHVLLDHRDSNLRAHVDFRAACNADASRYPDVPWPALLGELLRFPYSDSAGTQVDPTDPSRNDEPGSRHYRIYGQININTAPKRVIERLPWKTSLTAHGVTVTASASEIATRVVNYRDRKGTYATRANAAANLRQKSKYTGFLTPGEIAVPLADLIEEKIQAASATTVTNREKAFFELLNGLYGSVANCIAVNSDVFAANICVQLVKGDAPASGDRRWHYVAVVDRSACYQKTDSPALLMFTQVR